MDANCNYDDIKSTKLYVRIDRIYDQLKEMGYDKDSPLKVEDVSRFDSWHYHGNDAIDKAIKLLGIKSHHRVLDIGSGLGGPARYISYHTGCQVVGVDLQDDACTIATDLTSRCGLADKVKFISGDILNCETDDLGEFDFVVSWLVFLHITEKQKLMRKCAELIKKNGFMYVEAFCTIGELPEKEVELLRTVAFCEALPSQSQYVQLMEQAGFKVQFDDLTSDWAEFVSSRLQMHCSEDEKKEKCRIYGEETYESLKYFYTQMNQLFANEHFGGGRFICSNM